MKEGGGLAENMAAEIGAWGYGERRLIEDASDSEKQEASAATYGICGNSGGQ
jgi:hypothetical protein